ncbi:low temperature requirement protein A [Nakamurella panacisegetis]|nr:low temperature requirement protein A [Nakamurella panacisegetis]
MPASPDRIPWRRPMAPRSRDERHRASTPLECLFDLCFVVAVSRAGISIEEQIGQGHPGAGVLSYAMIFFAIWWAWMNFTWFASAYDNDDVPYRISVLVQIAGSLVLAAGVTPAFDPEHRDFTVLVIGYVVMRLATVSNWLRAARSDPERRMTALRYAGGIVVVQVGWVARLWLPESWGLGSFVLLALLEMAVPAWAERTAVTPYHPSHIAERYGLFTVIVLGESVTAVVVALEAGIHETDHKAAMIGVATAGILILFSMWWVYFDKSAHDALNNLNSSLLWGYGHYLIFASIAAVGAGLNIAVEYDRHEIHISGWASGLAVTVPVTLYLVVVWALHLRHRHTPVASMAFPVVAVLVLASTFFGAPIHITAVLMIILVAITVTTSRGRSPVVGPTIPSVRR